MNLKKQIACFVFLFFFFSALSQNDSVPPSQNSLTLKESSVYHLKPAVDIPLVLVTGGWSAFGFTKIYSKDPSTKEEILSLDKNDLPFFDRWAAGKTNEAADNNSDYIFYGSIPLPFTLLADKEIRGDAGKIGFLYLEVMAITGLFYTGTVYFIDRYRPMTYNTSIPVEDRMSGNFKDAFIAGHPGLVATATFFTAKIYSDYHPDSKFKYALYGVAVAATGTTAYLRHIAGKHFPSDLFAGISIGTLSGILVPQFHKNKPFKDHSLGFMPFYNGCAQGVTVAYKLK